MKSRMEKYYKDEDVLQRTTKNTNLYDELYKEKQEPDNNVTFMDNVNEIDIEKIKDMVNNREEYKKVKQYEELVNKVDSKTDKKQDYELGEIDDSNYDINQIIEKKRISRVEEDNPDKVRKLCDIHYEISSDVECSDEDILDFKDRERNVKELIDTITDLNDSTDFFANLKETDEEKEETKTVKESSFYTSTVTFENEDFKDEEDFVENKSSTLLKVLISISFLLAIGVFVWFKFFA